MATTNLISIQHICTHCNAETTFIHSLHEYGLLEIITEQENNYISEEQIKRTEQMIHLYYDLGINIEGIDAIIHLLSKVETMQHEMLLLKSKLNDAKI